jgi:hypothetical protein
MTSAPTPNDIVTPTQFEEPRKALCQFVAEVRRDLEDGHTRLSCSESVEQLISAATHTHKTLVGHGQTLGEYVEMVQNWRQPDGAQAP